MATTTTSDNPTTERWASRALLAFAVRALLFLVPIIFSLAATVIAANLWPKPSTTVDTVAWWVTISAIATSILLLVQRYLRRFLPIVALLRMSLVFPDEAPSRFRMALRTGTVNQFHKEAKSGTLSASAQRAAENLLTLSQQIGNHDRLTRGHSERVRAYSDLIAEEMGLPQHDRDLLHWAALLHDVGKLDVPAEILNKDGKPDAEEWAVLQTHPGRSEAHLAPLAEWLGEWRLAASQHHERWDGKGYPDGLSGTDISLAGRIVAVADAFDTITSVRSYKTASTPVEGREEIARCAGTQFDPAVVKAFLAVSVGELRSVAGPLGWLAQIPILASIPSAAAPVTNAVTATVAAGATAVTAVASGVVGVPAPEPGDQVTQVAVVAEADLPDGLVLAFGDSLPPTPGSTPPTLAPTATPVPSPAFQLGPIGEPTATPTPFVLDLELTPTPEPSPTPPPTPPPGPTPTPTPAPSATPTPTPSLTPTPSPSPTASPTPTPTAPQTQRLYLENPDDGATSAQAVLGFTLVAPTDPTLNNFDRDRNFDEGLTLLNGDGDPFEADPEKMQRWAIDMGGDTLSGPAVVRLYATPSDYLWNEGGDVTVALMVCDSGLVGCAVLAQAEQTLVEPADGLFGPATLDLGVIQHAFTAAKPMLVLKILTGNQADHDIWLGYDTARYPAYLDITALFGG